MAIYKRLARTFEDGISARFVFHLDGVSDAEQSTYVVAALSASFNRDFRADFKQSNFPIKDALYSELIEKVRHHLNG